MKKINKIKKFLLVTLFAFFAFTTVLGIGLQTITTCAEEIPVIEDTIEDSNVLDGETNNSAILDEIKNYIDSRTGENGEIDFKMILIDVKFWIYKALEGLGITSVCSLVIALVNRKNRKDNVLTEAHVERIATSAAKKTAENVIGKSIDVDISAEVSKAVEQKMHALANTVGAMQESVKNAEVLMASVAMAQSKSRLLTDEERKNLQSAAMKCAAHAGKKVVSTAKIELTAAEEKAETNLTEIVENKNIHFLNFDGVKKK